MNVSIYWTIWISLALFCAGEVGRRDLDAGRRPPMWTWWACAAGLTICIVHVAIAMGVTHGWSHAAAIAAAEQQTSAVYGLNWGGGVYVNYAFMAVWFYEAWRWRRLALRNALRPKAVVWAIRIFYLVMILNAAVVFAGGARRVAGALCVLCLLWIWRPRSS